MNAATICVYGILAVVLTMFIVYLFPTNCEVSRTEGFENITREILTSCPAGSKSFVNASGQTMCCKGTVNGRICEGRVLCSFSEVPGSSKIGICTKLKTKYKGPIDTWVKTILTPNAMSGFERMLSTLRNSNAVTQPLSEAELNSGARAQISTLALQETQWLAEYKKEAENYGLAVQGQELMEEAMYIFTQLQKILTPTGVGADPVTRLSTAQELLTGPKPKPLPYRSPKWVRVPGILKQIQHEGNVVCGVTKDHTIWCADQNIFSNPNWFQLPGGLKHISVSGTGAVCGTNVHDDIWCADNYRSPQWKQIPGKLKQIDLEGYAACGVNANDDIFCADYVMNPRWEHIPGKLKHITLSRGKVYGVNSSDNIYYGGNRKSVNWKQIPGGLKQVDMDGNIVCGVNMYDDYFCKEDLESGNWKHLPGKLKYISINQGKLYGSNWDDLLFTAT